MSAGKESLFEFRLMVSGSRKWPYDEWATVYDELDKLAASFSTRTCPFVVLHGGAMGVDSWADEWARSNARVTEIRRFDPDYGKYGIRAPHVRNDEMLSLATYLVAFWDGKSRGTRSVIDKAQKRDLSYQVHSPSGVYVEV